MGINYAQSIYAGVLGKLIGVYLGRPVEGWSYEKIRDTFGDINYYVHKQCGVPLIVADDDISGTFGFFRAVEDNGNRPNISAKDVGDAWLNYIIEDKTILWWGGLGRSTEHTAYLNLKRGIPAPQSGSIAQNGRTLAEQIGAQIFVDAFAMACPGDPEHAVDLIRKAASVSHDGLAVDAACYLGAMEAAAFVEKDLNKLMDGALQYISDPTLLALIADVRDICAKESDWRTVRDYLNSKYGYHIFPGCCHMVPNHAMVLASLILGGDNFQKSISIASSAAWDTDCNAGNVGALNGIRLGLAGINSGADFRTPVSDLMYVVTADGGEVVTDAVRETNRILRAVYTFSGETTKISDKRYSFAYSGSTQGFEPCPYSAAPRSGVASLCNLNEHGAENGLLIGCDNIAAGISAEVSTPTFIDFSKLAKNFSTVASPTLYSGQTVTIELQYFDNAPLVFTPYLLYYDVKNNVKRLDGDVTVLKPGANTVSWEIPETGGMPVFRFGCQITSEKRFSGNVAVSSIDWTGAPKHFAQKGMMMTSIWDTTPYWTQIWASSAKHFAADFKYTYCVSHPEPNGVVTVGTREWDDYTVASNLCFALHETGGLVARVRGHRRYYAAVLTGGSRAKILMRQNEAVTELAGADFAYGEDTLYNLEFRVKGTRLELCVDGKKLLETNDSTYTSGGAGFLIENGTMTADGFSIEAI